MDGEALSTGRKLPIDESARIFNCGRMYNLFTRRDFVAAGLSTRTIRQALNCCVLKLSPGIYSVISSCQQQQHRRLAAFVDDKEWLALHGSRNAGDLQSDYKYQDLLHRLRISAYLHYREHDVLWGVSAAVLHHIPLFGVPNDHPISVINPTSNSRSPEITRTKRAVDGVDTCCQGELALTTPVRTSLELTRQLGQQAGFAAQEWVLRRSLLGPTDPPWLKHGYPEVFVEQSRNRVDSEFRPVIERLTVGRATARRMADCIDARSESIAESYCSFNLHALGISGLDQQVKIYDHAGLIARVDFIDHVTNTIIEVDGIEKYVKVGREQMSKQTYQQNRLLALGYTVIRFRFSELLHLHAFATKLFAQAPQLRRRWESPR